MSEKDFSLAVFTTLSERMREDWNRRVRYDYRLWVTNTLTKNAELLDEGERDFAVFKNIAQQTKRGVALEVGCGVGRMLPAAKRVFQSVLGVDISEEAIQKARTLLDSASGISVETSSGFTLENVADNSIDYVWSFASMPHMPTRVFASYLSEIQRVVVPEGLVQLQVFLGEQAPPNEFDTLRMRAYTMSALESACALAGLQVEVFEPITMPLSDCLSELGIEPVVMTCRLSESPKGSIEAIAAALLPDTPELYDAMAPCADFEAWLATHYADRLHSDGDFDRARRALEYVIQNCKTTTVDVSDIMQRLEGLSDKRESPVMSTDVFEQNMACLRDVCPAVYSQLVSFRSADSKRAIRISGSEDGPVLWSGKTCLDHPQKPIRAAEAWVKRTYSEEAVQKSSRIIVVGFGAGYHIEALLADSSKRVSCIEPDIEVLYAAFCARDLRTVIPRLESLVLYEEQALELDCNDAQLIVRPQAIIVSAEKAEDIQRHFYATRGTQSLHPRIAVLGPLQGGTLSIGEYTTHALQALGQNVRGIDMSGFNDPYMLVSSLIRDEFKQKAARQMYIETLSTFLLESLTERPIDILICMAQAPISPKVLMEFRKRGVITVLWFVEDYLRFTYWKETAQFFDYVFTIQKGVCIEEIRKAGAGRVHYLPTACNPLVHAPVELTDAEKERWGSPLSFVGAGYYNRQQTFASLSHYPLKIWGTEWPTARPFDKLVQESGRRLKPEEYNKIFNATDVNINLHSSTERDGVDPTGDFVNPRTFELASAGAFQLVDERSLLAECFIPGEEIVTFSSVEDLRQKIEYYRERPSERMAIAEKARTRALRDHTYEKRVEQMLEYIYAGSYKRLQDRQGTNPWSQMIEKASFDPELQRQCERASARGADPVLDGIVSEIVTGHGSLTEAEQKLLFLHHVKKQILRMDKGGAGVKNG